ncbi:GNAT family protein [Rugamonas sp.]|uniref:GNAT family N-acetyltransferase n=1 Tax=Rugamonas sp. TaxID=1926287 RepID=UPI0025F780FA|nr:GNAT family protein [Rugamonas sp.]
MPAFEPTHLNTERLALRPIIAADAPALLAIFSDPQAMRYWSSEPWTVLLQAEAYVDYITLGRQDGSALCFGVTLAAGGALIGTCTLYAFDHRNRRCEMGYMLSRAHWGHGYMPEALAAMLDHGFDTLDLHRVEADIHPDNAASERVLERLRFQREGRLRERWFVGGELSDSVIYGLLRADWHAARPR